MEENGCRRGAAGPRHVWAGHFAGLLVWFDTACRNVTSMFTTRALNSDSIET